MMVGKPINFRHKGAFTNYNDHLPTPTFETVFHLNSKYCWLLQYHLPISSCQRSMWTPSTKNLWLLEFFSEPCTYARLMLLYLNKKNCNKPLAWTYLASTFSEIRDLVFPKGNRHTGQVTSFGWHSLQTTWPLSHWNIGALLGTFRHTGHSSTSLRSSAEIIGCLAAMS